MLKLLTLSSLSRISQGWPPELWEHRQKRNIDGGPVIMFPGTHCGPRARGCQPLPTNFWKYVEVASSFCLFVFNVLVMH